MTPSASLDWLAYLHFGYLPTPTSGLFPVPKQKRLEADLEPLLASGASLLRNTIEQSFNPGRLHVSRFQAGSIVELCWRLHWQAASRYTPSPSAHRAPSMPT